MIIYVLDDEPIALRGTINTIQKVVPEANITGFSRANDALRHITDTKESPDVVFSDIEMPGMGGLNFAVALKRLCPEAKIIFVTAYSQYAIDAFRLHVHGYILKPITAERVREELDYLIKENTPEQEPAQEEEQTRELLKVQCFGYFEVFWKGEPLMFGRRQTKELLAYLIDRKGATCTSEEIATALWEDEDNLKHLKARIRILISDLRQTLAKIGMEDIILRRSGQIAIRRDAVDCDYYHMLDGDMEAVNAYRGEYMKQYSWAEITAGQLTFGE